MPVDYRHVKGHSGHPWNELADVVASGALQQVPVTPWPEWMLPPPIRLAREVAVVADIQSGGMLAGPPRGPSGL
eukprot:1870462-Lingulodinium_polyedra.AAC.1